MTFTNNDKFTIQGEEYTIIDLRDKPTMWQGDESYFGRKRNILITADSKGDRQTWDGAPELENGERIYIDGICYVLIVTVLKSCNGVKFITYDTFKYIDIAMQFQKDKPSIL